MRGLDLSVRGSRRVLVARRGGTGSFEDVLMVIETPEAGFWRCSGLSRFGGELGDDVGGGEEGGRK